MIEGATIRVLVMSAALLGAPVGPSQAATGSGATRLIIVPPSTLADAAAGQCGTLQPASAAQAGAVRAAATTTMGSAAPVGRENPHTTAGGGPVRGDYQALALAVRAAFTAGAGTHLRELLADGVERFPDDAWLRHMKEVTAPPVVTTRGPASSKVDMRAYGAWVRSGQARAYAGRWVAVRGGEVVAHAPTLRGLLALEPGAEAVVVKVPAEEPV